MASGPTWPLLVLSVHPGFFMVFSWPWGFIRPTDNYLSLLLNPEGRKSGEKLSCIEFCVTLSVIFLHAAKTKIKYNLIKLQANKLKIHKQKHFSN